MSDLMKEVSRWKLDAKLENSARYFYKPTYLDQIAQGEKAYIIGRKGTGKTAICEHIIHEKKYDAFSKKLSFKNFPFNLLYGYCDSSYVAPNQYISIWKYLIYTEVFDLMVENESIDLQVREKLSEFFGAKSQLIQKVQSWEATKINIKLFGSGIEVQKAPQNSPVNWLQQISELEEFLVNYLDSSTYFILFDELDEDYRNIIDPEQYEKYTSLLTGLFKAVQDVKSIFSEKGFKLFPIVVLRDDIYDVIQDSDKNKWTDYMLNVSWTDVSLKKLLAHRVSRAIDPESDERDFHDVWHELVTKKSTQLGGKPIGMYSYILSMTHLRPRDFVFYLKSCAEHFLEIEPATDQITEKIIKTASKPFSAYLYREILDEMGSIFPNIDKIMRVFQIIGKPMFTSSELNDAINVLKDRNQIEADPDFIIAMLFYFSVIGNSPHNGGKVFRYLNKDAILNRDEKIILHRGYVRALQVF